MLMILSSLMLTIGVVEMTCTAILVGTSLYEDLTLGGCETIPFDDMLLSSLTSTFLVCGGAYIMFGYVI